MRAPPRWVRRLGVVVGVAAGLLTLDYWVYPRLASPSGLVVNRAENGLWLRYTWYFGEHSDADLQSLSARLQRHGIQDAFFHVRSVGRDGSLRFHNPDNARRLNHELHLLDPRLRRFAWVFVGNRTVNLADETVRRKLVAEAVWLIGDCGFQGVQWDYETCSDGDTGFLKLLDECRQALPSGSLMSVDAATWYPGPLGSQGWSPAYYGEVAKRCDQIAVMAYDSGLYFPRVYTWWVGRQVEVVTRAVARTNAQCRVLVGVPTYADATLSHNPRAETLRLGLIGVRDGLPHADQKAWQGVALFADYTTSARDWDELDRLWPVR
jgi:hypothetical protein